MVENTKMDVRGRLAGKVAVITGAARGMGKSHALAFLAEGAKVVLTDIEPDGREVAEQAGPTSALFLEHDVTDPGRWQEVVGAAEDTFGRVDALVNNAGISIEAPLDQLSIEAYERVVAVNQTSVFHGMRAVVPAMRRAGGGSIINISSLAGLVGGPNAIAYSASKFAVRGMTKVAAIELGRDRIRVNSVHPGAVKTPMLVDNPNYDILEKYGSQSPLGRLAESGEVSPLVVFLASEESGFCTGAEFVIDGGATAT